jgi:DNA-binding transcriptional ArsR family regulator
MSTEYLREIDERKEALDTSAKGAPQRAKGIEEMISYALAHRVRIEILAFLNEGVFCAEELAEMVNESMNVVYHHLNKLAEGGSIEIAKTEPVRNTTKYFYCAVEMPFYTDEQLAAMHPQQRQMLAGLILQSIMAESLSAFWAGKMHSDPRVWLSWRWFNVDDQGRADIADEQQRHWDRIQEIEAESTGRRAESGEKATSIIVASLAFERTRTAPSPSLTSCEDKIPSAPRLTSVFRSVTVK